METKFTPLFVIDSSKNQGHSRIGTIDILNKDEFRPDSKWIAQIMPYGNGRGNFPDHEEAKAYAQLFAAAPDMKKAIELALNIKDLWAPVNDIAIEHEGEAQALQSMLTALQAAYLKA